MMETEKDRQQDELIRVNAEHARRNEEAIRRQTECLEKIRDHYFPKMTPWKRIAVFFLKVVGAVTVAAGLLETGDWYLNTRESEAMAMTSARVAKRLLVRENDVVGAMRFLEKAVELDGDAVRYRMALAYVKGIATIVDFMDVGRPLTPDERARVDAIHAQAVFLQEVAPNEAMPHVLAAQTLMLRGDSAASVASVDKAVSLAPDDVLVRINACAMRFAAGDFAGAKRELAVAARLESNLPFVAFWQGRLALACDHDRAAALAHFEEARRLAPNFAPAHLKIGEVLLSGDKPDGEAARASLLRALAAFPKMKKAMLVMGESYARDGKLVLARLWFDRALACDGSYLKALTARAEVAGKSGDWAGAAADLTRAIDLAPFQADLYRARAGAFEKSGDTAAAAKDRETAEALRF